VALDGTNAMASGSDTHIGRADADTRCLGVAPGHRVRIAAGLMSGAEAVVIQQRTQGRVLVRLLQGVYLEIHQFCLERIRKVGEKP
jgi:hypothetical protein